jgi:hypothetical protein
MTQQITMDSVESSQIHSIGHDPATNTLAIRFLSRGGPGSLYHYSNLTTDEFAAFRSAESKGAHFGKHIKPFKDKYPFVKVESVQAAGQVSV